MINLRFLLKIKQKARHQICFVGLEITEQTKVTNKLMMKLWQNEFTDDKFNRNVLTPTFELSLDEQLCKTVLRKESK